MSEPINLLRGWPAPSLLPADLLLTAAHTALSDPTISTPALLYGPDQGYAPLRTALSQYLQAFYRPRHPTTPSRLAITGGASQNLGCLLSVYTDPAYTRAVWVVAPAYFLAFRIFEDAGFGPRMRAVPEDDDGVDVGVLRREMRKSEEAARREGNDAPRYKPRRGRAKVYKHVVYCVPTFANPSSRTMSLERRRALVGLAREFDALVVCDDVYDFLQWPADVREGEGDEDGEGALDAMQTAHLPRLVDIDGELDGGTEREGADGFGNACSNGSFSKIAGPGLRAGWLEGTDKFAYGVGQTGTTRSGGAPSQLISTYLTPLLSTSALQTHIRHNLLPAYARRYRTLLRAIDTHLTPLGFGLPARPSRGGRVGGFFVWLSLPEGLGGAAVLARRCVREGGVVVAEGGMFEVPGTGGQGERVEFDGFVRLCFAWVDEGELVEGVRRVGVVARGLLKEGREGGRGWVVVERGDGGPGVVEGFK